MSSHRDDDVRRESGHSGGEGNPHRATDGAFRAHRLNLRQPERVYLPQRWSAVLRGAGVGAGSNSSTSGRQA